MINVKCKNDYSVQNDKSLCGHCTNDSNIFFTLSCILLILSTVGRQ